MRVLAVLVSLLVAPAAWAQCDYDAIKVLWSWPASGQADVPTNTQVFLSTQGDVARVLIDGEPLERKRDGWVPNAQFAPPHELAPNSAHRLRIELVGYPSADGGVTEELDFTTGAGPLEDALGEPRVDFTTATTFPGSLDPLCESVVWANGCYDTVQTALVRLHSHEEPVAWVVDWGYAPSADGEQVFWPGVCGDPSVFVWANRSLCYRLRALDAAGHEHVGPVSCPPTAGEVNPALAKTGPQSGCGSAGSDLSLAALLLALARRRRQGQANQPTTSQPEVSSGARSR